MDKYNQAWWEWSFKNLQTSIIYEENEVGAKFMKDKVTSGFHENLNTALNKVCETAYKSNVLDISENEDNNKFRKSDVWRYCSPRGIEP